jgi:neutral ceramidase
MPLLTAGFALSKITPPPGTRMAGYGARTGRSLGVHDELQARALVLDDGRQPLAMVSVDVLALDSAFVEQARAEINRATGLAREAVMIAATHTHGGPVTALMYSPVAQVIDAAYMECLRAGVVNAVTAAWKGRSPARIGIGATRVEGIGGNRHRLDGATDPELGLLKITDLDGQTRAVCLNYACHPTVLGPDNRHITADYPGFAVTWVAERLGEGTSAMFLNGAAGNISVGRSPEATALGLAGPGRTFERATKIGRELADLAVAALPSIATTDECTLDFATRSVELPLRPLPTPHETKAAMQRAQELVEERRQNGATPGEIQKAQLEALYSALMHFEACRRAPGAQQEPVEIQCFRIGGASFLCMPVEPFVEIGLELKRAAAGRMFIVELANGYMGYLPAVEAREEDGYETVSARFAADSDRILVARALELERELFERGRRNHS